VKLPHAILYSSQAPREQGFQQCEGACYMHGPFTSVPCRILCGSRHLEAFLQFQAGDFVRQEARMDFKTPRPMPFDEGGQIEAGTRSRGKPQSHGRKILHATASNSILSSNSGGIKAGSEV
jgi:hypothetical protein